MFKQTNIRENRGNQPEEEYDPKHGRSVRKEETTVV
jgi:hypothetical protein